MTTRTQPQLVLASSSPFRLRLLKQLQLSFTVCSPEIDEVARQGEQPVELVRRLAISKARAITNRYPEALIIGSDQVAVHDGGKIVGKPKDHADAIAQLREASGKHITLYTGLCLLDAKTGKFQVDEIPFAVHFRVLSDQIIERYLLKEQPYGCSGSLKADGLGIALLQRLDGTDPNALIGLPLIRLVEMLEWAGVSVI